MRKHVSARGLAVALALSVVATACSDDSSNGPESAEDSGSADGESADTESDTESGTTESSDVVDATSDGGLVQTIQDRGRLQCGVSGVEVGFSAPSVDGPLVGFDVDMCRAIAAAILGDATAMDTVALNLRDAVAALESGDVDLLQGISLTQQRDIVDEGDFGPVTYVDGPRMMGRVVDGFTEQSTTADIGATTVCTVEAATDGPVAGVAGAAGFGDATVVTFSTSTQAADAFIQQECILLGLNGAELVGLRAANDALADWAIFPPSPITIEARSPMYRQGDPQFADVVNWTVFAMILADEAGSTSQNASEFVESFDEELSNRQLGRLFGVTDDQLQSAMGLAPNAFHRVITQVGNYDEVYARHFVALGLVREGSVNARWTDGGLIYAPSLD